MLWSSGLEIFEEAGLVDLLDGGTMYGANLMAGGGSFSGQKSGLASLKSEDGGCTEAAIDPPEVAEVNKGLIADNTEVVTGELEGFGASGLLHNGLEAI